MKANMDKVIEFVNQNCDISRYDITYEQLIDLLDNTKDTFEIISKVFKFGFGQGVKYQKARKVV